VLDVEKSAGLQEHVSQAGFEGEPGRRIGSAVAGEHFHDRLGAQYAAAGRFAERPLHLGARERRKVCNRRIDPRGGAAEQTRILVVKSVNNFVSGFSGVARTALYVAGPGALDMSFASYAYTKLQRPIWPLDAEAFAAP